MVIGRLVSMFYRTKEGMMPQLYTSIRTTEGKKFFPQPILSDMRPYFYINTKDAKRVRAFMIMKGHEERDFTLTETDLELGIGNGTATKVELWNPYSVRGLKKQFARVVGEPIIIYEADIPYDRRFRIDKGIKAGIKFEDGKYSAYDGILPKPRNLYIDIEVDDSAGFPDKPGEFAILCIGTVDDDGKQKFFTWTYGYSSEVSMLKAFHEYAMDYDHIVVWNKDFEQKHISMRARKLDFWGEWKIWRMVDLAEFYRMYYQKTFYEKLPYAYGKTLKKFRGKLVDAKIDIIHERIQRLPCYFDAWKSDPVKLEEINQSHAYALYIIEKAMGVIELYSGVADETGVFIDYTHLNSHVVDTLAMRKLRNSSKQWVVPSTGEYGGGRGFRGAVVFPPKRGVHDFVFLFDFTSLYNRIIQSYLLDPICYSKWKGTFTEDGVDAYVKYARAFGEIYGIEVEGMGKMPIFPAILHQLEQRRNELKSNRQRRAKVLGDMGLPYKDDPEFQMYDQLQKAAKVVLLACYGVLGMSSARWAVDKPIPEHLTLRLTKAEIDAGAGDYRVPNKPQEKFVGMVTHLAREALERTKEFFESDDQVDVTYGDTDSTFVQPKGLVDHSKTYRELTRTDMDALENFGIEYGTKLEEFYKDKFESGIEMKLEKIFDRGVFGGKKKQYYCRTLWDEDSGWQITEDGSLGWYEYYKGLPLVRTDRCEFLRDTQKAVLIQMLDNPQEIRGMLEKRIKKLNKNQFDDKLILRIGLKRPIDTYAIETMTVRAAKKLIARGENVRPGEKIAFIITDVVKRKAVVEPIDESLEPADAVKPYTPISRSAINYYWTKRIWKNIEPFLQLVLSDSEIAQIKNVKDSRKALDAWLSD